MVQKEANAVSDHSVGKGATTTATTVKVPGNREGSKTTLKTKSNKACSGAEDNNEETLWV